MRLPGFSETEIENLRLRAVLGLPTPILRALSGGGVTYVGGRTLDPRFQFLAAQARGAPPLSGFSPEVARAGVARMLAPYAREPDKSVRVDNLTVPGPAGPLPARSYRAKDQDPALPLMIFGHFGGGVIGDLDTCHAFCAVLARDARLPVLSVEYRLAPENRFPAALEDMLAAYRWGRAAAEDFGAPRARAAIGGDSMGGNFAAVICQELRRASEPQPALQLLIYPALDVAAEGGSMATYGNAWPLDRATMEWFMGHYIGAGDSPDDPRLSPVRAKDLGGLAAAVIATAGFDPLLDQGETYARRLRQAGVPVTYRCYDHLPHAFTAYTGVSPEALGACRDIARLTASAMRASS
ncbi:MAG TPA: alpha/beta hydrolase [Caulobacteraceae bacterium]|nr:alpha/beta hydrolase [Caulobacteraceae bacterium]